MLSLVAANIRQRPFRTLISVVGIALGVNLVMLFTGLADGMSKDMQRRSSNIQAEILFTRPGSMQLTSSTASLDVRYVPRLKSIEGVAEAVPVILYITQGSGNFGLERTEGVEWDSFASINNLQLIAGRAPAAAGEVVIDETKQRNSNLDVGAELKMFGDKAYRVVGIYAPESGARVKMSLAAMQEELEVTGKCTYILVKCRDGASVDEVAARINEQLPGNKIQLTRDISTNFASSIPFLGTFLRVLVGLAGVVSTLVIMLAMYTTITERTREIGTLKALGASRRFIIMTIEQEALLISIIGLIVGFITAMLAGALIERFTGLLFAYSWRWAIVAVLIGIFGGVVGALYPATRAANLDPVDALAYE